MNSHREEGWRIKRLRMSLDLLIGVPRRCWQVDIGMVFVVSIKYETNAYDWIVFVRFIEANLY